MSKKITILKFITSLILIVTISLCILYTKLEFPFAIFFIVPIAIYSVQEDTRLNYIIILSLFGSVTWLITYLKISGNGINMLIVLQAFTRLVIYFSLSFLLYRLRMQQIELVQKNHLLSESNNEKNNILGIAAHDIRTSAGAIYSFSELLLENLQAKEDLKEEIKYTNIINASSNNLLKLVTGLLDLSQIQSGQIKLNKSHNDYNKFIEDRIELLQIFAVKKNIKIIFHRLQNQNYVLFDPVYLSEVIDNLITNAIKYSNNDSKIEVKLGITKTNFLLTEVIDFGIGINNAEISNIFKPFTKTSSKPTEGEKSTGLGLAIVKRVIELHGGAIGVESKVNSGSIFYFTIPYSQSI